jgi:hypothetical protein
MPSFIQHLFRFLLAVATLASASYALANTESRLALIIGNSGYKSSPLTNPVNDARLMETTLKELGFTVIKAENASRRDMQRAIRDFGDKLKQSGGVGLFYFAGHGLQVRGANYLIPVDADIRSEDEVAYDSIDAQSVLEKMESANNRVNLIVLDACRDNPFARNSRSSASGLATIKAPSGSLVAYATAPGSVASDGTGTNGLYTRHLVAAIKEPGLPVEEVFKRVRANVRRDSNNQQTPWENTALEGQFFFRVPVAIAAPAPAPVAAIPTSPSAAQIAAQQATQLDIATWDAVKASSNPVELQVYLSRYPQGLFADIAKARISALQAITVERAAADKAASERAVNERAAAEATLRAAAAQQVARMDPQAAEIAFWDAIKLSSKPGELEAYLAQYPSGLFASLARARLIEANKPKPLEVALSPQQIALAGGSGNSGNTGNGFIVLKDTVTGKENRIDVFPVRSDSSGTKWSTGDEISSDGKVINLRLGNSLGAVLSGDLWSFPLSKMNSQSGSAKVNFNGNQPGTLDWKVTRSADGTYEIEKKINMAGPPNIVTNSVYGIWTARYLDNTPIPTSQKIVLRSVFGNISAAAGSESTIAEFKKN